MQSTLQEPIWGMLTQGTPRGRLEFGMMNLEIQHEASTCNWNSQLELSTRTAAARLSAIRHRRFAAGLLRLGKVVHKIAVLVAEFLNGFESELD